MTDNKRSVGPVKCLLVYPEFQVPSFWNCKSACTLAGAQYLSVPLGMMTVAAMLPLEWELKLVDKNVAALDDCAIEWADLVMIGGMLTQQSDHLEIIQRARAAGKLVVSGGPDATSSPHIYAAADHLVLGEAEVTLPWFIRDFQSGDATAIYQSEEKADMTRSPIPRWDLVDRGNYLVAALQWSRGCPFNCEFCDIIELFGRVPRLKSEQQVTAELNNLYLQGHRGFVDIVDDNFIGNKKQAKKMLAVIGQWQREHGWPFEFGTESSLNLANEPVLLDLMQKAGFCMIFVGLESTDEEALRRAQKKQNLRRDMVDAVHTLYAHGIAVNAGYIIGIDGESENVADGIIGNIQDTAIPMSMVGLMFALPRTQLTRRLRRERRLTKDFDLISGGDQCTEGLNFTTDRPKSEILGDYARVVETIYSPQAYFDRVTRTALALNCSQRKLNLGVRKYLGELATLMRILWRVGLTNTWAYHWWKLLLVVVRRNPKAIRYAVWMGALYVHFGEFAPWVVAQTRIRIEMERAREAGAERQTTASPPPGILLPVITQEAV